MAKGSAKAFDLRAINPSRQRGRAICHHRRCPQAILRQPTMRTDSPERRSHHRFRVHGVPNAKLRAPLSSRIRGMRSVLHQRSIPPYVAAESRQSDISSEVSKDLCRRNHREDRGSRGLAIPKTEQPVTWGFPSSATRCRICTSQRKSLATRISMRRHVVNSIQSDSATIRDPA